MMKKIFAVILISFLLIPIANVYADDDIKVFYNGKEIFFYEKNIIINDRTLVQLRPIAEALDLQIEYTLDTGCVILSNADAVVTFQQNSNNVNVNGVDYTMNVPMIIRNNYSFVPIRDLVEPFGNNIEYNGANRTITITKKIESGNEYSYSDSVQEPEVEQPLSSYISVGSNKYDSVFFYQSQPELKFANNGRGYCWVCSYSMLFSNVSGKIITPVDVAEYNIKNGYSGNYMAGHKNMAKSFGLQLVPALSKDSPYYAGFDLRGRGETTLNIQNDEDAKAAIKEALDNFPHGVLVRYEGMPHTMMAVGYDEENIYFNDPGLKNGEHVPFEQTCLKRYKLSDISFIQAVK